MNATERKLAGRLADKLAIRDCVERSVRGLDRGDAALARDAFLPDSEVSYGSLRGTRDAVLAWAIARHGEIAGAHQHHITSHLSDIAGDVAHAQSYVIFGLRPAKGDIFHGGGARYLDRLERRNGQWRIALRRVMVDWQFDQAIGCDGAQAQGDLDGLVKGTHGRDDPSYAVLSALGQPGLLDA